MSQSSGSTIEQPRDRFCRRARLPLFRSGRRDSGVGRSRIDTPALLTCGIAALLFLFGLYNLSGAGVIRRLPFVKAALLLIGGIFTLRGVAFIGDVVAILQVASYPFRTMLFSSLLIGASFSLASKRVGIICRVDHASHKTGRRTKSVTTAVVSNFLAAFRTTYIQYVYNQNA